MFHYNCTLSNSKNGISIKYALEFQERRHVEVHISELLCDPESAEEVGGTEHVVTSILGMQAGPANRLNRQSVQDYIQIICKSSDIDEKISCCSRES